MKIEDIRKRLIGKTISWYDGFSGSSDWFTIGHIENFSSSSIRVRAAKGNGWGIFIPKDIIVSLLSLGTVSIKSEVEGCSFATKWSIC